MRSGVAVGVVGALVASCLGNASADVHTTEARVIARWTLGVRGVGSGIDHAGVDAFWMVDDRGALVHAHADGASMTIDESIALSETIDAEEVRALPGAGFLVVDERGPSVVHVSPLGVIDARFTPEGFEHARRNRGFEGLALSADGSTAYAVMQAPMGETEGRVVRVVRLDVRDPMNMRETGVFAVLEADAHDFESTAQHGVKVTAAAWLGDDRLALLEHGVVGAKAVVADLRTATNLMSTPLETSLDLEALGPATMGVMTATITDVWSTASTPELGTAKLEGLAVIDASTIALSDDDDRDAQAGHVWTVALAAPLAL
jgi:hypothetical protein